MLTFLFWNINQQDVSSSIGRLAQNHAVDLVVLAESKDSLRPATLQQLGHFHFSDDPTCPRLQLFSRFPSDLIRPIESEDRFRSFALPLNNGKELLLFTCHFISLLNRDDHTPNAEARAHARRFSEIEEALGNNDALVLGDLNLNPFSPGIAYQDGFHAVMSKQLALRRDRNSGERLYYNPMWSRLGDASPGPPGTYYYTGGGEKSRLYWHTFDQVLLRPSLLDAWHDSNLIQPLGDGVIDFLTRNGIPDKNISDHLPLICRLNVDLNYEQ